MKADIHTGKVWVYSMWILFLWRLASKFFLLALIRVSYYSKKISAFFFPLFPYLLGLFDLPTSSCPSFIPLVLWIHAVSCIDLCAIIILVSLQQISKWIHGMLLVTFFVSLVWHLPSLHLSEAKVPSAPSDLLLELLVERIDHCPQVDGEGCKKDFLMAFDL